MASGSGRISFLRDMTFKNYPCFSGWSTPMHIPLSRLHVFKTKGHKKLGRESVRGGEGRNWGRWMERSKNGGVDFTKTYHMHIRSSIFKRCKITIETLANHFKKKERKLYSHIGKWGLQNRWDVSHTFLIFLFVKSEWFYLVLIKI